MSVVYVDAGYGLAAVNDQGDYRWQRAPESNGHSILAELHAIGLALEWLAEERAGPTVILCDNTSAVKSMHGVGHGGPLGARELADRLRADLGQHTVAWVPREANSAANALARQKGRG